MLLLNDIIGWEPTSRDFLRGLCWTTSSGQWDTPSGSGWFMWISKMDVRDTPRNRLSGLKSC